MVTREELLQAFGDEGLLLLDVGWAKEKGLSDRDAQLLSELGLPVRADLAFTTVLDDELRAGTPVVFQTGNGEVAVLILGGVTPDGDVHYFLDVEGGSIGLLSLGDEPHTEVVNSSLENFVEFLYRLRKRQQELVDAAGDLDNKQYTEQLWIALKELDPIAFGHGEAWWPMVLDNLMERSFVTETRAFLEQRRAEVAETLAAAEAPTPEWATSAVSGESRRGQFERALYALLEDGYAIVDAEQFEADNESYGLLCLPADLDEHFDADGALVSDLPIAWKGALTSKLQSLFARQGLVVRVPEQGMETDDLLDLSEEELQKQAAESMDALVAAADGTSEPDRGIVTCLATDESSDLCQLVAAFDRLTEHGYVAEPDLWPTPSGGWEQVQERTKPGDPVRAVFWTSQRHADCFDDRGDLVEELHLQWAGDPVLIAEALATSGLEVETPEDEGTAFAVRRAS